MRAFIRFLGGVRFSLALFFLSALLIGIFTLIDLSQKKQNALFSILICAFFINLFVSLCSRFPLRKSHLPFALAHCGLMMILASALIRGFFGSEGVLVVGKEGGYREMILDGDRASALLLPFKRACEKVGYSYEEMLHLWFSDGENAKHSIYPLQSSISLPLQEVMDAFAWESLPLFFQTGAFRLSRFLKSRKNTQIGWALAQEVFQSSHLPVEKPSELTASMKAHLYSCCLFFEGLQDKKGELRTRKLPYAVSLAKADGANHVCHLIFSEDNGVFHDAVIAVNQPYDTLDRYRFTLAGVDFSNDQAQLLVSWSPISSYWIISGTVLTVLGIILLFFQKMGGKRAY